MTNYSLTPKEDNVLQTASQTIKGFPDLYGTSVDENNIKHIKKLISKLQNILSEVEDLDELDDDEIQEIVTIGKEIDFCKTV